MSIEEPYISAKEPSFLFVAKGFHLCGKCYAYAKVHNAYSKEAYMYTQKSPVQYANEACGERLT